MGGWSFMISCNTVNNVDPPPVRAPSKVHCLWALFGTVALEVKRHASGYHISLQYPLLLYTVVTSPPAFLFAVLNANVRTSTVNLPPLLSSVSVPLPSRKPVVIQHTFHACAPLTRPVLGLWLPRTRCVHS